MSVLTESRAKTSAEDWVTLNLGEWNVSTSERGVLACLGLGSCVALCAYDAEAAVAGMAHMVLPSSATSSNSSGPKFVDIAIPMVISQMERRGAERARIACYLVGGAHILKNTTTAIAQVGERNIEAARAGLKELGLRSRAEDIGGERGRTVRLHVGSGLLEVAHAGAGAESRTLANGRR